MRAEIQEMKKEQSSISMMDEFARYARLERKINKMTDKLKTHGERCSVAMKQECINSLLLTCHLSFQLTFICIQQCLHLFCLFTTWRQCCCFSNDYAQLFANSNELYCCVISIQFHLSPLFCSKIQNSPTSQNEMGSEHRLLYTASKSKGMQQAGTKQLCSIEKYRYS